MLECQSVRQQYNAELFRMSSGIREIDVNRAVTVGIFVTVIKLGDR